MSWNVRAKEETYHYEIEYDRNDDVLSIASLNNPADLKLDTSLKASYLLEIITGYHQKKRCGLSYSVRIRTDDLALRRSIGRLF